MALLKPVADEFWKITSGFKPGGRINPVTGKLKPHNGIDLSMPIGTEIFSIEEGTVIKTNFDSVSGLYIIIDHGNNLTSKYLHLSKIFVKLNEKVEQGQLIALSGNTGLTTGPHLHFSIQKNGIPIDPAKESLYNINYNYIIKGFAIAIPIFIFLMSRRS